MRLQFWKQEKTSTPQSLYLKCGAILLLFLLSVLIVACGSNGSNTNLGQPDVTVTINLDQANGTPPPLPEYTCTAWVTNTSPGINTGVIGVYAKFVHNVNGNPEGVPGATGTAYVNWPDGNTVNVTAHTTADGLAVFPVSTANRSADLNKIVLVTVNFQGPPGVPQCTVDTNRAAFFTLVIATGNGTMTPTAGATGTAVGSPTASPTFMPSPDPTICPLPKRRCK